MKKLLKNFIKKNLYQKEFRIEKVIKKKMKNYMLNGTTIIIPLLVELMKNILLYKVNYFPESYTSSKNKIKIQQDLSVYARKSDLKKRNKF